MDIIRRELDDVTYAWNCHRIRSQKHGDIVPGIPDLLYNVPEMLGIVSYLCYKKRIFQTFKSIDVRNVVEISIYM